MFLSYTLGAIILILVLLRQLRIRPVPRVFRTTLPLVVGVVGLFEVVAYAGDHHVSGGTWAWVLGALAIGAVGVGALRGLSMRVWKSHQWVVRQGTPVTMALWLASLLVHFAADDNGGARGFEGATFLLYLGVTLAVQAYVVHLRATALEGPRPRGRTAAAVPHVAGAWGRVRLLQHRRRAAEPVAAECRPRRSR